MVRLRAAIGSGDDYASTAKSVTAYQGDSAYGTGEVLGSRVEEPSRLRADSSHMSNCRAFSPTMPARPAKASSLAKFGGDEQS
jgi:hypothetical protein